MATKEKEPPALLNKSQASAILGVSLRTMHRILEAGSLEPVRIAGLGRARYRRSDVERLVRDGRAAP